MFELCNVVEHLTHSDSIVSSLVFILTKQHGIRSGKFPLKTPGNAISETLYFKMSLDTLALKNLCLWWEFQSRLLFIISLLLKNFLTALRKTYLQQKARSLLKIHCTWCQIFLVNIPGKEYIIINHYHFEINISDKKSRRFDLSEVIFILLKIMKTQ